MRFGRSPLLALVATSTLTLVPPAIAQGGFDVVNKCPGTVYYKLTNQQGDYASGTISQYGGFDNGFQGWGPANDGISVKMDYDGSFSSPLQYEVVQADTGMVWYDLSAENGDPFSGVAKTVFPTYGIPGTPAPCQVIHCDAGSEDCEYTPGNPSFNPNYPCPPNDGNGTPLYLTLVLCDDGAGA